MWFERYVSVGCRIIKAKKKLKQLLKKNPMISPIVVQGNKIVTTWWGKAWTNNLHSYADYDNRVGRGRSYVKNGFVFHLEIRAGKIKSMIMGGTSRPHDIEIHVSKISKVRWGKIVMLSKKHITSLSELFKGRFPEEMSEVFSDRESGIFPTLKEIEMQCSCPDWAKMCKHVSATLFAVGVKLDKNPELMFKLRGVNGQELIDSAIQQESKILIDKRPFAPSQKVLKFSENKLSELFNINLETSKK